MRKVIVTPEFAHYPREWHLSPGIDTGDFVFPAERRAQLLRPEVMAEPTLFLCSDEGARVNDERIIAMHFAQWQAGWLARRSEPIVFSQ